MIKMLLQLQEKWEQLQCHNHKGCCRAEKTVTECVLGLTGLLGKKGLRGKLPWGQGYMREEKQEYTSCSINYCWKNKWPSSWMCGLKVPITKTRWAKNKKSTVHSDCLRLSKVKYTSFENFFFYSRCEHRKFEAFILKIDGPFGPAGWRLSLINMWSHLL